jgi:hypothetical protein
MEQRDGNGKMPIGFYGDVIETECLEELLKAGFAKDLIIDGDNGDPSLCRTSLTGSLKNQEKRTPKVNRMSLERFARPQADGGQHGMP